MDVFEAIRKRASVRSLEAGDPSDADLTHILDAARRAPSGSNRQPLQYIVIRDTGTLAWLDEHVQGVFATAGAAIGVVADPDVSRWWLEDAAAATENMLLSLTALGYASVWVEGTLRRVEDEAKKRLGVPKEKRFPILLPVGKASEDVPQADKKPLEHLVWRERYGHR